MCLLFRTHIVPLLTSLHHIKPGASWKSIRKITKPFITQKCSGYHVRLSAFVENMPVCGIFSSPFCSCSVCELHACDMYIECVREFKCMWNTHWMYMLVVYVYASCICIWSALHANVRYVHWTYASLNKQMICTKCSHEKDIYIYLHEHLLILMGVFVQPWSPRSCCKRTSWRRRSDIIASVCVCVSTRSSWCARSCTSTSICCCSP